jgi:flavin-dependent dehydrogenase
MTESNAPLVVVGGGPGGAAAALALARGRRRVLLLEEGTPGDFKVGEGLPPAARPLLRDLGVLEHVLEGGHLPCPANVSAWGSPELHATDFLFDLNGHGWHLDRARFDASLREAAARAGVEVRLGAKLTGTQWEADGWRLSIASGDGTEEVRCAWLIDATGRRSAIARRYGATRLYADGLVAFFARFHPGIGATDRDGRTLVESRPDGWWYTARVPSGERVVAYLTDADLVDRASLLSPEGFVSALEGTTHLRAVLSAHGYALQERPRGADAGSARLDRFVGPGWLAAGDAALSFDPLSSQGITTALYTGMKAGQALVAHLAGDGRALEAYSAHLESIHAAYWGNRASFYGHERRWADRPFWARRHSRHLPRLARVHL